MWFGFDVNTNVMSNTDSNSSVKAVSAPQESKGFSLILMSLDPNCALDMYILKRSVPIFIIKLHFTVKDPLKRL